MNRMNSPFHHSDGPQPLLSPSWAHTPADDAEQFGFPEVAQYIKDYEQSLEEAKKKDTIEEAEEETQAEQ